MSANYKGMLGEWAQARGEGAFADCFELEIARKGEQKFCATLTHLATDHEVVGLATTGKKATEQDACRRMWDFLNGSPAKAAAATSPTMNAMKSLTRVPALTATRAVQRQMSLAGANYKGMLGEWAQARGEGAFADCFELEIARKGEQKFCATLTHLATEHEVVGLATTGKKATEQDACRRMWEYVSRTVEEVAGGGDKLRRDAWLGDRVLAMCLALKLEDGGDCATTQDLSDQMNKRANNEELIRRMGRVGLERSGKANVDASRVEQWIWQVYNDECGRSIRKTMKKIAPLLA